MPGTQHCRIFLVLILLILVNGAVRLFARDGDSRSSLTQRLAGDAADGRLDQFSLLEAALIAGGLESSDEVANAVAQFEARYQIVLKKFAGQPSGERVHAVFDGLHQQFLHGDYRADYSEMHRTLGDGHFNCVTATILFRYLCERCDVKSEVIASPNHVLCRVPEVANQFIETTCPECHSAVDDPRTDPHSQLAASHSLRVISDVELVGKVFYNRGVAALDAKHYSQATDLLVSAGQFDRADTAARKNLLATLNNWALAACDKAEYETASQLVARGLSLDATYPPLQSNDLHVHQQWVKSLCNQQRFAQAIEVLDEVLERHPDATPFVDGRLGVYGRWAESLFVEGKFPAAWTALDQAKKRVAANAAASAKFAEVESSAVIGASEKLIQTGRTTQAQKLVQEALSRQPQQAELLRRKLHLPQADL